VVRGERGNLRKTHSLRGEEIWSWRKSESPSHLTLSLSTLVDSGESEREIRVPSWRRSSEAPAHNSFPSFIFTLTLTPNLYLYLAPGREKEREREKVSSPASLQ
jgi:hypothetical protein